MSAPEVSVVVPTHNRRKLLQEMLEALPTQTYRTSGFEVVVVVDGSSDGTWEMLQAIRVPYEFHAVRQEQSGPSTARNLGVRSARGEVLLFLDDDLLPQPQLLDAHFSMHRADRTAVVLGRFLPAPEEKKNGWDIWEEQIFAKHYKAMEDGRRPPAGRRLYSGNFSIRRELFSAVGGFDERLRRGEDVELGFRLEKAGARFYFNSAAAAVHRGYRSFDSWVDSAHVYGRTDVLLTSGKENPHRLEQVLAWYMRQPIATQLVVGLCIRRTRARLALVAALRAAADGFTGLRLSWLARYGYSAIYKIQYWHGVAEQMGGSRAFGDRLRHFADESDRGTMTTLDRRSEAQWTNSKND